MEEKDECEVCHGASGGVRGNENVIDGVVMCDYCHAKRLRGCCMYFVKSVGFLPGGTPMPIWQQTKGLLSPQEVGEYVVRILNTKEGSHFRFNVSEMPTATTEPLQSGKDA